MTPHSTPFRATLAVEIRYQTQQLRRQGERTATIQHLRSLARPPSHSLAGAPSGPSADARYASIFREVCEQDRELRHFIHPSPLSPA